MISKDIKLQLFKCRAYIEFLRHVLKESESIRGYKKRLAESAGCQPAYLSQVIGGHTHLTPEQAERLCVFWDFSRLESDYFFNLVLLGRAGTLALQHRLKTKLDEIRETWQLETQSFGKKNLTEPERAALYYSHWLHSAIHLLLTIPGLQTAQALATHLHRNEKEVLSLLESLQRAGLVEVRGENWRSTHVQIHAPQNDFFAEIHHKNWRSQALEVRNSNKDSLVRYTSVHSISMVDAQKIKNLIDHLIEDSRRIIEPSPEELGACLLIDYFSI